MMSTSRVQEKSKKPGLAKTVLAMAALAASLAATVAPAEAAAIRGGEFNTNTLSANDDGSTGAVSIGFGVNYFGLNFNQLFVNNNGNVTFDSPLGTFTPFDLTSTGRQIIAPFFADVDTRGISSGLVTYGAGTANGRTAFGVNWLNVGYFPSSTNKTNSFQLVLIDRSDTGVGNFDIEFNYDDIEWETGGASGGVNGLGGSSARVGFSNGTGAPGTSFELPGSAVNGAFLNGGPNSLIANSLNSDVDGRYVFTARNGIVDPDDTTPIPTPALLPGLVGLGVAALRKRGQEEGKSAEA
jgi:Nidogen-like